LSFEAADCFAACFAFLLFAFEVGACGWVDASLGDGDAVEGAVELAVAAAVEAVALVFAGAGVEGCDAGVAGELGVGWEAVDRADLAEQLRRAQGTATRKLQQPGRQRGRACVELAVELADRAGQCPAAADEVAGDPHLCGLFASRELPAEPVEPDRAVERTKRHRKCRVELVQVPAQPLLAAAPLRDQVVAVVDEQLQLSQCLLAGTRTVQ
jgi:hypothetical protein